MSIPLSFFLIIYTIFVLFWLIFSMFNIFHAVRFGLNTPANKITLTIYIVASGLILLGSLIFISSQDWSQQIELLSVI